MPTPIHDATRARKPTRNPPRAAETMAAITTTSRRFTDLLADEAGRGQESGVGHHAVIGPDGLALDVPRALQHLERLGHVEPALRQRLAQLRDLDDRREVRHEDPAGVQRL